MPPPPLAVIREGKNALRSPNDFPDIFWIT